MKSLLKIIFILSLVAILVVGIVIARQEMQASKCRVVSVHIVREENDAEGSVMLLKPDGIIDEMRRQGLYPVGKPMSHIDLDAIEKRLGEKDFLEGAQCVIQDEGVLSIYVRQMVPVMRVFGSNGRSWYYNKDGKHLEADVRFHVDVPIVHADFRDSTFTYADVLPLVQYVNEHKELHAFVTDIIAHGKNDIYIVPNVVGMVINFGGCDNIENKFAKLAMFYEKVLPVKGSEFYDTITVKWNHQVVANRRVARKYTEYDYDPELDEQAVDIGLDSMAVNKESRPVEQKNKQKN